MKRPRVIDDDDDDDSVFQQAATKPPPSAAASASAPAAAKAKRVIADEDDDDEEAAAGEEEVVDYWPAPAPKAAPAPPPKVEPVVAQPMYDDDEDDDEEENNGRVANAPAPAPALASQRSAAASAEDLMEGEEEEGGQFWVCAACTIVNDAVEDPTRCIPPEPFLAYLPPNPSPSPVLPRTHYDHPDAAYATRGVPAPACSGRSVPRPRNSRPPAAGGQTPRNGARRATATRCTTRAAAAPVATGVVVVWVAGVARCPRTRSTARVHRLRGLVRNNLREPC